MATFTNYTKFSTSFTRIATTFLVDAKHLTKEQAESEIEMIIERVGLSNLVDAMGKGKHENAAYVRMSRVGSTFSLNRQKRVEIAMTLNNAINHAGFEEVYC